MLAVGLCAQLACIWEATARKPGNVHRYRDFDDTTYLDFLLSAAAIAPSLDSSAVNGVGPTVLEAVRATRQLVRTNTNLGIVLVLAPLAAVPRDEPLRSGVERILAGLTLADSEAVVAAIRFANPTGLGRVEGQDVRDTPTLPLRELMALAGNRDLVARQYANAFSEVFDVGLPAIISALNGAATLESAIIACHLTLLARYPDSLIVRKCGEAEAREVSRRAAEVLALGWATGHGKLAELDDFDAWLRENGRRRNPGTTADLVAASLFTGLRQGDIAPSRPALF